MATNTTKLGLIKPDFVDVVDVSDLNTNFDDIDAAAGATICTSTTRPGTPWAGQVIFETDTEDSFVWTGSAWIALGGGASVTVSTTAPTSPDEGDLWLDSTEAKMYVWYDDGSSAQWVAAVGGTVPQQGKILQVVSTTKTDTFTTSSQTFVDVTGLAATITPSSTSSKILILADTQVAAETGVVSAFLKLLRDSTDIYLGDSAGSRIRTTIVSNYNSGGQDSQSRVFLDSPNTTSAVTYKFQIAANTNNLVGVNRSRLDTDSAQIARTASSITLMEVAG